MSRNNSRHLWRNDRLPSLFGTKTCSRLSAGRGYGSVDVSPDFLAAAWRLAKDDFRALGSSTVIHFKKGSGLEGKDFEAAEVKEHCLPYNSPDIFSKCMILEYPNMWKSSLANLQAAAEISGELLILWIKLQPNKSVKSEKYLNVLLLALLYRCVCLLAVEGPHFHCSQSNNAGPSVDSWMTLNYYLGMSYIEFSNDFRWAPWSRCFLNSISDMYFIKR